MQTLAGVVQRLERITHNDQTKVRLFPPAPRKEILVAKKIYRVLKDGRLQESDVPGRYAGWRPGKIFGRLDCRSGMRMKKENRVFFLTWQDAIDAGYRPCKKCRPTPNDTYPK